MIFLDFPFTYLYNYICVCMHVYLSKEVKIHFPHCMSGIIAPFHYYLISLVTFLPIYLITPSQAASMAQVLDTCLVNSRPWGSNPSTTKTTTKLPLYQFLCPRLEIYLCLSYSKKYSRGSAPPVSALSLHNSHLNFKSNLLVNQTLNKVTSLFLNAYLTDLFLWSYWASHLTFTLLISLTL
jgi:hypothetical protein